MIRTANTFALFLLLFTALVTSCAGRPAARSSSPPEMSSLEPTEPFERAIWNIKMNTSLIKKYIDGGRDIISGSGIATAKDILLKGECRINGNEFRATYNLADAVKNDKNQFFITFIMEDRTNGILCIDKFFWSPAEDKAGLLLSFDDDYWHTWRGYFDMFDSYGARVTFFVRGSPKNEGLADFCAEAIGRGHSLGFHTVNHYDLTMVSQKTFSTETIEGAKSFLDAGIPFSAFAFPYGFSQPWMHETLASYFRITRGFGTNIRYYDAETIKNGYIISKSLDNIMYPNDDIMENDIRLILLIAKFTGYCIIPITTHDISDTAQWGIKPQRLEFILKTAQELKLKFYTYNLSE